MRNVLLLDKNKNIQLIVNNDLDSLPLFEDKLTKNLDDFTNDLLLTFPANHSDSNVLDDICYILYPTNVSEYSLYKVKRVKETYNEEEVIEIEAEISARNDLIKNIVRKASFKKATVEEVAKHVLNNTKWEIGNIDDFGLVDIDFEDYPSNLSGLISLCEVIDGEFNFRYELKGMTIVKQYVDICKPVGDSLGKLYMEGIDLTSVEIEEDYTELYTALVCVGGDNTSFDTTDIKVEDGFEIIGDTLRSKEALKYTDDGQHIIGVYESSTAKSSVELYEEGLRELKKLHRPITTYRCDVAVLNGLLDEEFTADEMLGKYISISKHSRDIYLMARVRKTETSLLRPEDNKVEFGDYIRLKKTIPDMVFDIQNTINKNEAAWNEGKYNIDILSSAGNSFIDGKGETVLKAIIKRNNDEIDMLGNYCVYTWTATDNEGNPLLFPDGQQTKTGKQITVNANDYNIKATYSVTVELDKALFE